MVYSTLYGNMSVKVPFLNNYQDFLNQYHCSVYADTQLTNENLVKNLHFSIHTNKSIVYICVVPFITSVVNPLFTSLVNPLFTSVANP